MFIAYTLKIMKNYILSRYRNSGCPARGIQSRGNEETEKFILKKEHNHAPDSRVYGKAKFIDDIKFEAETTNLKPREIIPLSNANLDHATLAIAPNTALLRRTIRRARKETNFKKKPTSLEEFEVTDEFGYTKKNYPFLLDDNHDNNNRIVIFGTKENLQFLSKCEELQMDGTFDVAPPLFKQLYTIFGRFNGWNVPLVFVLCCSKTQRTYEHILQKLIEIEPSIQPKIVIMDFERAVINAVRLLFKSSQVAGCYFHFSGSLWKHVQGNGLQTSYAEDAMFALNIRMFLALAFVPVDHIERAFEELLKTEFCRDDESLDLNDELQAFITYFENTYIGAWSRDGKRKKPLFGHDIWSVFDRVMNG